MAETKSKSSNASAVVPKAGFGNVSQSRGRKISLAFKIAVSVLAGLFAIYPVLWIVSTALNPVNALTNQRLIPANATLDNFRTLFNDPLHPFPLWMWNSIKVSGITAVITVALCALAAYSFSRFRYRGRRQGLLVILLVQLFPNMLAITALFLLLQQIGKIPGLAWLGLNTLGGLILIYCGGALGFNTWLMKGFFDSIPKDLDESAMIDGATPTQTFFNIILPLVRPILAVIAILSFIGTYSDFLIARVMITKTEYYTLALGMTLFVRNPQTQTWNVFSAAALMGAVPIMLVFLILQKQLIGGLASGAVKG
jgi:arabinogalactan oligomer / maltooligosaccharide transport system permease protein